MSTGKPVPWNFRSRFRHGTFGWRGSKPAIARIDEALAEIRAAARGDPVRGAEGAVLFLEKLSPALSGVDSSSGALGNATAAAVATLACRGRFSSCMALRTPLFRPPWRGNFKHPQAVVRSYSSSKAQATRTRCR